MAKRKVYRLFRKLKCMEYCFSKRMERTDHLWVIVTGHFIRLWLDLQKNQPIYGGTSAEAQECLKHSHCIIFSPYCFYVCQSLP